jgi:ATP-dependent exoDNAse (exonuclease V) alpha subunit
MELASGDRLQLKANGESTEGKKFANGELVTVRRVTENGALVVMDDDGGTKTLAPSQRVFVRGYAVTSYGSQGKTVDTVLFADAANRAATNANQWYVSITRGRKRVVVFTSDKVELRENIVRAGDRELAVDLKPADPAMSVNWPAWQRRAQDTAERYRLHQAVAAHAQNHRQNQRIAV